MPRTIQTTILICLLALLTFPASSWAAPSPQQDENAVAFAALGEDFLTDPGYWPDGSDCHTTLRINGVEQQIGSVGRIVDYREDEHGAFVRGQAPEAYPLIPGFIGHAERKLYFVRGPQPYIVWRDDVGVTLHH